MTDRQIFTKNVHFVDANNYRLIVEVAIIVVKLLLLLFKQKRAIK